MTDAIRRLEAICAEDPGGRNVGPLLAAARGGLEAAARSLAAHPAPHVCLVSGCFIPGATPPAAETDGPVGLALLAALLAHEGIPVRVLTDEPCAPVVAAALGPDAPPAHVVTVEHGAAEVDELAAAFAAMRPPVSHVIAIERLGPAADGRVYDMRGEDVSSTTAPIHRLFAPGPWVRVAVGDGGNEIGMGNVAAAGGAIACTVPCDHLIVAGVSNWGAAALCCALAVLRPRLREWLRAETFTELHDAVLRRIVRDGPAVDGIARSRGLSVDGLPAELHTRVLERMLRVAHDAPRVES